MVKERTGWLMCCCRQEMVAVITVPQDRSLLCHSKPYDHTPFSFLATLGDPREIQLCPDLLWTMEIHWICVRACLCGSLGSTGNCFTASSFSLGCIELWEYASVQCTQRHCAFSILLFLGLTGMWAKGCYKVSLFSKMPSRKRGTSFEITKALVVSVHL